MYANDIKKEVALIIVFNHRYDKNIEVIEDIYKNRFTNIYFLIPFYSGTKKNVIPVFENSYYFQGYFAQGFPHYFNKHYNHYFFIADDLILNPEINENNYKAFFNLSASSSFISEFYGLDKVNNNYLYTSPATLKDGIAKIKGKKVNKWYWCRVIDAYNFNNKIIDFDLAGLPSSEEATELLKKHAINTTKLSYIDIHGGPQIPLTVKTLWPNFKYLIYHELLHLKYKLKYPFAGAYSDIVIISGQSIEKFIKYCGLFAAAKLFVEIAVPTALLFASNDVVTEINLKKKGKVFWPQTKKRKELYESEMNKFDFEIERLLGNFPNDWLYLHPVKLSKWK